MALSRLSLPSAESMARQAASGGSRPTDLSAKAEGLARNMMNQVMQGSPSSNQMPDMKSINSEGFQQSLQMVEQAGQIDIIGAIQSAAQSGGQGLLNGIDPATFSVAR